MRRSRSRALFGRRSTVGESAGADRLGHTAVRRIVLALVGALALAGAVPAGAAFADPLPVPPTFFSGIGPELVNPGGSLPGVNEWDCKPTAEHPEPVILVHGTGGGAQTNWGPMAPRIKNAGYCVYALTYGAVPGAPWPLSALGGFTKMEDSAGQLSDFVDRVLAATGAEKVDFVGHSQGTLMPTYYVKYLGGADKVAKYVSLAPLWKGTDAGGVSEFAADLDKAAENDPALKGVSDGFNDLCGACQEMTAGSEFMRKIKAGGVYAPGIEYTNIMTKYDELVVPYTAGYVEAPNATNIVVQDECSEDYSDHLAIAASVRSQAYVLNALDPAHPIPVPCVPVVPFFG